mgnify:CR=1 FL=1
MLWRILQAHGGTLPDDVRVMFANTGKEMPETLDFVEECSVRWQVPIIWVEYRQKVDGKKQHAIVTHATASRNGEPFSALIESRNYLPNVVARFCTVEMKIRSMHRVIREWGWDSWTSCVGIRADEQRRVAKLSARRGADTPDEIAIAPLAEAGVTVADVGKFWGEQPFDLRLPNMNGRTMHGNCDLCFLKGAKQVYALIREQPKRALWWIAQESKIASGGPGAPAAFGLEGRSLFCDSGTKFRMDRPSYARMYQAALAQSEMFEWDDEALEDCACTD